MATKAEQKTPLFASSALVISSRVGAEMFSPPLERQSDQTEGWGLLTAKGIS